MQFQILNNGRAITMGELDEEAAAFFGVEVDDKHYAEPDQNSYGNWFDFIGGSIAIQPKGEHEWSTIIGRICGIAAIGETSTEKILDSIKCFSPYIDLCLDWQAKGYVPVSC